MASRSEAGVVQGRGGGSELRRLLRRDGDSETAQGVRAQLPVSLPVVLQRPEDRFDGVATALGRAPADREFGFVFRASQRFDRFSVRMLCPGFEGDHDDPVEK